jgi:AcrR family transcriptional regulator
MINKTQLKASGDKRQAVLDTALRLFVEQGFHSTSTASIAKHAGVATGTLFHHFSSKNTLMDQLFLSIKQEFANDISMHISQPLDVNTTNTARDADPRNKHPRDLEVKIDESEAFKQEAEHIWQAAIDWALNNPLKQRFFYSIPCLARSPSPPVIKR